MFNPIANQMVFKTNTYVFSDNMILSTEERAVPIFPIGRFAAKNEQEIKDYLEKVMQHDQNQ